MTNVEGRIRRITRHEVVVPLRDGTVTRRDVSDLLMFSDSKYEAVHGKPPKHDDAYLIEASEDELVAVIVEKN